MKPSDIPIPEHWPPLVRRAVLHVASLARTTMILVHSTSEFHEHADVRTASKLQRRDDEIAMLNEHMRILRARIDKIEPGRRPHYPPAERMAILTFKAARGWNNKQTAEAFGVTEQTIANWMKELDEEGPDALVQIPVSVNKYPDFVKFGVQQLKALVPLFGNKTIAEYFVRAGLYLSGTSVGRYIKAPSRPHPVDPIDPVQTRQKKHRRIVSRHPDDIWLVDLTTVPTCSGFWNSIFPFALPQVWPFSYWVGIVIDHFSRKVMGFALFRRPPSSKQVTRMIDKAIKRAGRKPRHIITDKGPQFFPIKAKKENRHKHPYFAWCRKRKINSRFGAIGKHGSIALIERFMRTLKTECTRRIIVPFDFDAMRREIAIYVTWYNEYRPHQSLNARTPEEVHQNSPPLPRLRLTRNCDLPEFRLEVSYFEGRRHLPVVEFKKAA